MHLLSGLSIKCIGRNTPGARDKRVTTCSENPWGNGIAGARLYPVGYTSGFPSRRDRTTIAQRFSVGSRARTDQVPKGRLKFIPISSRKTCCSFSRPFGTHAMRNWHPNVENVGLFSAVPPGQRKHLSFRVRKAFLMVTILSCTHALDSSIAVFKFNVSILLPAGKRG